MATNGAQNLPKMTIAPKVDSGKRMRAVEWHGKQTIKVNFDRPVPTVTDPGDVILRVTSTCICGSDLHLYLGSMAGMQPGDVLGHEFMGIVHEVGPEVKNLEKGDRVVTCFDIGCGACFFCSKLHLYSACDVSNPSKEEEALYGDRTAGFFGYSHLTGGYPGGQAEYVRVPLAELNTLKVPDGLPDEKVIFLSDILPTAWHANELGDVGQGDTVAIWGCGPVGILAALCAKLRGAREIFLIDNVQYRLDHAQSKLPYVKTINFDKEKVRDVLRAALPHGPDVGIDAVGMHYALSRMHKAEIAAGLETDTSEIVNEVIYNVRKGGRISLVAAYGGYANHYNLGGFMEKGLQMRGGQTPVQRYWKDLLHRIEKGEIDPTIVITHQPSLEEAPNMYKIFNEKSDNCIKVVMHPNVERERTRT